MSSPVVLDYDMLSETYRLGLVTRLRGFKAGEEGSNAPAFLVSWVCHEDDVRSVEELLDAAHEDGTRELTLRFRDTTVARIGAVRLEEAMRAFGETSLTRDFEGVKIEVSLHTSGRAVAPLGVGDEATAHARTPRAGGAPSTWGGPSAHALYDAALSRVVTFPHEGGASASAITSTFDGATLAIDADADTRCVTRACHHGASGDTRALLEVLCATIEGLPLREVADHGALRAELVLRGRGAPRPVAGVTTVGSADSRLLATETLLRRLVRAWEQANGETLPLTNEFVPAASASWQGAPLKERRARVDAVLDELLPTLGLRGDALRFSAVERDVRVVLEARDSTSADLPSVLFAVERVLKERVEPELSVYVEEMRDTNVLRRLTKPTART